MFYEDLAADLADPEFMREYLKALAEMTEAQKLAHVTRFTEAEIDDLGGLS